MSPAAGGHAVPASINQHVRLIEASASPSYWENWATTNYWRRWVAAVRAWYFVRGKKVSIAPSP